MSANGSTEKTLHPRAKRQPAALKGETLARSVARLLCREIRERLQTPGAMMRAAKAAGFAHPYLSQIKSGQRVPLQTSVYLRLLTEAFHLTFEEAHQLIAKAKLEEMGFTSPELSLRLAEFNLRSKQLTSDQMEGLIDYLEGWLVRRRRDAQKQNPAETAPPKSANSG